jgi:hypothetical protein
MRRNGAGDIEDAQTRLIHQYWQTVLPAPVTHVIWITSYRASRLANRKGPDRDD